MVVLGKRQPLVARALVVAALAAGALFAPGATSSASADACSRHGDTRPVNLTVDQARNAIRCLINKERGGNLGDSGKLNRASQYHSRYMRDHTCFSHRCGGEKSTEGRLRKYNYIVSGLSFWTYGENIGYGEGAAGTPRNMVQAWMRSPGHRANILNSTFRDIGVGFTHGSPDGPNELGGLYTTDFGTRRG